MLPRVDSEIMAGFSESLKEDGKIEEWIGIIANENPQLLMMIDAMREMGPMFVLCVMYMLLRTQAEVDELNAQAEMEQDDTPDDSEP